MIVGGNCAPSVTSRALTHPIDGNTDARARMLNQVEIDASFIGSLGKIFSQMSFRSSFAQNHSPHDTK
jgi:hypothetical protein